MAISAFTPTLLLPTAFVASGSPASLFSIIGTPNGAVLRKVVFANTTGSPLGLVVYYLKVGDSVATRNEIIPNVTILANSTYVANEFNSMVMNLGDSLWALATAGSSITATVSGFVY